MSSVIALNQIDGSELWKKVGFKPSEKVLVSLRGVYNLPFNLDDPVYCILYIFQVYHMKWFSFTRVGFILYIYSYKHIMHGFQVSP